MANKKPGSQNIEPLYKRKVFWQSVIAAILFPAIMLPTYLNIQILPEIALVLVIIYLAAISITVFWSLSNFLSDIVQKCFTWQSAVPLMFSGLATYTLFAATYGWWPFLPLAV